MRRLIDRLASVSEQETEGARPPRRAFLSGTVACAAAPLLASCVIRNHTRYKLTIDVELGGQVHRGTAVQEWVAESGGEWAGSLQVNTAFVAGEAVVIDLGARGLLFSTMNGLGGFPGMRVSASLSWASGPFIRRAAAANGVASIDPRDLPLLVIFDDLRDPLSIREVDPTNMAASLGDGAVLRAASIEIVSDRLTHGEVERTLPRISALDPQNRLDGTMFGRAGPEGSLSTTLKPTAFLRKGAPDES